MPRSGIMLCYPFEEERLKKWRPPYIVQPKLDGERCRAVPSGMEGDDAWLLISSQLNQFTSVPHINYALHKQNVPFRELDGELYCHGMDFESIVSRVSRTANMHPDAQQIEYHIFDVVTNMPQFQRHLDMETLHTLVHHPLHVVPSYICESLDDVMRAYDEILSDNYEGIVVRHWEAPYVRQRSTMMMKFKPKKQDMYHVIGYEEEVSIEGKPKGRLGSLLCMPIGVGLSVVDQKFSVGSGLTATDRERLWAQRDELVGKFVVVGYQHTTTRKGVPRFPVFIELIDTILNEVFK